MFAIGTKLSNEMYQFETFPEAEKEARQWVEEENAEVNIYELTPLGAFSLPTKAVWTPAEIEGADEQ